MPRLAPIFLGLVALHGPSSIAHAATKVACVGDSITENSGWCAALGAKLGANYQVGNFGVSGTTLMKSGDTPYWTSKQFTPGHDFAPNVVVIMLGTNDSKSQNWSKKANFVADYAALIDSYTVLASNPRIYACLPPPAGNNTFGISGTVIANEVLPLVRQAATAKNVPIIDVFTAFGGTNFDTSLFDGTQDQVHPNTKGAQVICDTVYAAVTSPVPVGTGGAGAAGASFGGSATGGRTYSGGEANLAGSLTTAGRANVGGRSNAAGSATGGGAVHTGGGSGVGSATPIGGRTNSGGSTQFTGGSHLGGTANGGMQNTGGVVTNSGGDQISGGHSTAVAVTTTGGATNSGSSAIRGGASSSQPLDAGGSSIGAAGDVNSTPDSSGCGCRTHGDSGRNNGTVALLLLAIGSRRRRWKISGSSARSHRS